MLKGTEGISIVNLTNKDIVRHKLVTRIVNAYEAYDKERERARQAKAAEEKG